MPAESSESPLPDPANASDKVPLFRMLRGNVGALSLVSLLNDASSDMIFPLLPVFLTTVLGAGPAYLGLIEGIADTTASLVKLFGGWISDKIHKRKVLTEWGYGIPAFVRPLIAAAAAPWHVLAIRFTDRIGKGLRTAPRDALLAESVDPSHRGAAFGLHRAADHSGAVIGPLLAAGLLLAWPGRYRLIFLIAAFPALISLVVLFRYVRDIPVGGSRDKNLPEVGIRDLGPAFPRYLGVLLLFTLGNATDAFLLLRAQALGVTIALIPVLWGMLHVSKMVWNMVGGVLSDRHPPRRIIVAGWLVYAAVYAGFAAASAAWHVWVLFAVYGLFYGLTESPEKTLVAGLAPDVLRARAFGTYHFAIGIGALPASLLFGALWQWIGPDVAFLTGAGLALLAALLLPLSLRSAPPSHPAAARPA